MQKCPLTLIALTVNGIWRVFTPSLLQKLLDIDGMTSSSKFCDVTWTSAQFMDRSVFYRPAFSSSYKFSVK